MLVDVDDVLSIFMVIAAFAVFILLIRGLDRI
jgi:hypothetical protein